MATVKGGKKCNLVTSWRKDWNSSNAFGKQVLLSQTFPIDEDTHISSIFVNTFAPADIPTYFCDIRATDGAGKPSGPNIASKMGFWIDEVRGAPGTWKMFFYDSFPLLPPGQYAIVVSAPTALTYISGYLLAQEGENHYRAGKCWISWDNGLTWERQHNRCFLFEVWGWPPPPDAPPEPAISNWAAIDLATEYTETTVTLVVTTDKPVHLYMRWTLTKPLLHPSEVYRRGMLIMAGTRFCFVSFHENEQEEAGDTLVHTFIKPDWPVCQTRWFYFIGQKQSIESPSASPIFHYHHVEPIPRLIFLEPWSEWGVIPPPEMELIFLEPWSTYLPTMEQVFCEPWSCVPIPPFADWIFWEPWGTFLTQYNDWIYLNPPPAIEISFDAGIITLTNHGNYDIGIDYSPLVNYPLVDIDGCPLSVFLDCPDATTNDITTRIGLGGYFHHPEEGIMHFALWIAVGALYYAESQYGTSPAPPWDRGWLYIGTGQHAIDILALWQRWRVTLGKSTDPTGWTISDFHFALGVEYEEATDYLKNDYIGFYYSRKELIFLEPWTHLTTPPPPGEQKFVEPWSG